ncbi:MAG: hypothetical protein HY674_23300 [Chloroflexi bacterium]|nr:hypothetical protein [Chloroflexota bacterium]
MTLIIPSTNLADASRALGPEGDIRYGSSVNSYCDNPHDISTPFSA